MAGGCCGGLGRVVSFAESARFLVAVAASLSFVMLVERVCKVCKGRYIQCGDCYDNQLASVSRLSPNYEKFNREARKNENEFFSFFPPFLAS